MKDLNLLKLFSSILKHVPHPNAKLAAQILDDYGEILTDLIRRAFYAARAAF